jgi:hypothetical protein
MLGSEARPESPRFRVICGWFGVLRGRSPRLAAGGLALVGALVLGAPPAVAAPPSEAKQLVTTGQAAMKSQRWADAVAAFRHADELEPSPQTKVELARALVRQGKLVDASRALHAAVESAKGAPHRRAVDAAKKLLDEVEPRVPWIQLVVQGPEKGVHMFIDGQEVDASSELPYDAGEHTVAAEADGFGREEQKVSLVEGAHAKLTLEMKKSAPVAVDASPDDGSRGKGSVLPAVVGLGVGAAGLALGAVFGVMAFDEKSKADDAKAGYTRCAKSPDCSSKTLAGYTSDFNNALDTSKTNGTISTVGFIVGGVGVAAGVTFLFWRPWGKKAEATGATITPVLGLGHAGVKGTF